MLVQIWHERSCQKRFDVFYGNKKLKGGEEYPLPREKLHLHLIERNPLMSKFWFLRALACFFAGLISGTFSDFKDIPRTRTQIDVLLLNAGEDLDITFTGDGYRIDGAETEELSRSETALTPGNLCKSLNIFTFYSNSSVKPVDFSFRHWAAFFFPGIMVY